MYFGIIKWANNLILINHSLVKHNYKTNTLRENTTSCFLKKKHGHVSGYNIKVCISSHRQTSSVPFPNINGVKPEHTPTTNERGAPKITTLLEPGATSDFMSAATRLIYSHLTPTAARKPIFKAPLCTFSPTVRHYNANATSSPCVFTPPFPQSYRLNLTHPSCEWCYQRQIIEVRQRLKLTDSYYCLHWLVVS